LEDDPDAPTRKPAIVLRADKDITYETINKIITLARSKNLGIFLVTDIEKKQGVPEVNLLEEP
jgi:biopolymer transport protein ExbD